jgi:hypothetical protein
LLCDIRPSPGSGQTRADNFVLLALNPQGRYSGDAHPAIADIRIPFATTQNGDMRG